MRERILLTIIAACRSVNRKMVESYFENDYALLKDEIRSPLEITRLKLPTMRNVQREIREAKERILEQHDGNVRFEFRIVLLVHPQCDCEDSAKRKCNLNTELETNAERLTHIEHMLHKSARAFTILVNDEYPEIVTHIENPVTE